MGTSPGPRSNNNSEDVHSHQTSTTFNEHRGMLPAKDRGDHGLQEKRPTNWEDGDPTNQTPKEGMEHIDDQLISSVPNSRRGSPPEPVEGYPSVQQENIGDSTTLSSSNATEDTQERAKTLKSERTKPGENHDGPAICRGKWDQPATKRDLEKNKPPPSDSQQHRRSIHDQKRQESWHNQLHGSSTSTSATTRRGSTTRSFATTTRSIHEYIELPTGTSILITIDIVICSNRHRTKRRRLR